MQAAAGTAIGRFLRKPGSVSFATGLGKILGGARSKPLHEWSDKARSSSHCWIPVLQNYFVSIHRNESPHLGVNWKTSAKLSSHEVC